MNKFKVILIVSILLLSACAGFKSNINPEIVSFPKVRQNPNIIVSTKFKQYLNDKPYHVQTANAQLMLNDKLIERFNMSGMFGTIGDSQEVKDPDYELNVLIMNKGDASLIMAFLTGITLYIIPSCATDNFELEATLTNLKTGKDEVIKLQDSIKVCQQLFLLPLMPFKFVPSEIDDMQNNLFDNLALRVHKAVKN